MSNKLDWKGTLLAVQPRIRLMRSFDQRSHSYLGYVLHIEGTIGDKAGVFSVGIGQAAQAKHEFRAGDVLSGRAETVADPKTEPCDFYKVSGLKVVDRPAEKATSQPPWLGVPPELQVYRERGHRRLDAKTYSARCATCIWGCRMPVEMIIDQWNPSQKKYRFETFCYGPKSCSYYRSGPTRKVPGRTHEANLHNGSGLRHLGHPSNRSSCPRTTESFIDSRTERLQRFLCCKQPVSSRRRILLGIRAVAAHQRKRRILGSLPSVHSRPDQFEG